MAELQARACRTPLCIVVTILGKVTLSELLQFLRKLREGPRGVRQVPLLWDFSRADLTSIFGREISRFYESIPTPQHPGLLCPPQALFSPADLAFGLSRIFQAEGQFRGIDVCVFRQWVSALSWLERYQIPRRGEASLEPGTRSTHL